MENINMFRKKFGKFNLIVLVSFIAVILIIG